MEALNTQHQQYTQILRLLFKFNLVPRSHEDEQAFILELTKILEI